MIIKAFNLIYFLFLAFIVLVILSVSYLLKNKNQELKEKVLLGICYFNIVFYVVYKFILYIRTPGIPDTFYYDTWLELPLQLCNISLFLVPLGIHLKNKQLLAYGFYVAPLGAIMAVTFPSNGFQELNIFLPHMIGFLGTHAIIIVVGILTVVFGLFRPTFKQIPKLFIYIIVMATCIFGINLLIREFTGSPANYFFTVEPEGISILELFWKLIPIPFLYSSLALVILAVFAIITTLPFYLYDKRK